MTFQESHLHKTLCKYLLCVGASYLSQSVKKALLEWLACLSHHHLQETARKDHHTNAVNLWGDLTRFPWGHVCLENRRFNTLKADNWNVSYTRPSHRLSTENMVTCMYPVLTKWSYLRSREDSNWGQQLKLMRVLFWLLSEDVKRGKQVTELIGRLAVSFSESSHKTAVARCLQQALVSARKFNGCFDWLLSSSERLFVN